VRGVSGRQVINPRATKTAAKTLPAHYAVPKAEGDGAAPAWIDLLRHRLP